MAVLASDHAQIIVDGYELSADSNRITINDSAAVYDVTAFGDQVRKSIRGSRIITLDHSGYMDANTAHSHDVLNANAVDGVVSVVIGQNVAPISGDPMYSLVSLQSKYNTMPRVGSYVPFAALFANRGDLGGWGKALAVGDSFTNTTNGDILDGDNSSANGAMVLLHVLTNAASDTYNITIQGSNVADLSGAITLGTFTLDASVLGAEHIKIAGTIPRYVRYRAVRTGSAGNPVKIAINLVRF